MSSNIPSHWYKYDNSLEQRDNAPSPSNANYSPKNVAWMMEFFASIFGSDHKQTQFIYKDFSKNNLEDTVVSYPDDGYYYLDIKTKPKAKSQELLRYEAYAKKSDRLKAFEDNSPAKIKYFKKAID